ncbi:MAG: glycosyltransferase family 4 protein, partial [bacterium]|nr:glycosyltransferase family 4 protein [bacterium]
MKIAIIVRKLNVKGGTQRQSLHLARELKKMGHEVTLYTFLYSPEQCYGELLQGLRVVSLERYPSSGFLFFQEYAVAKELSQMIDSQTDLLNPHDQVSYRVASYMKRRVRNIPSVWMMNDLPTKTFSLARRAELDPQFKPSLMQTIGAAIGDWYEGRRFIRDQDRITVLDERDKKWLQEYFGKEAIVVRSGIDIEQFSYAERKPISGKRITILMAGIFFSHRRFEDGIYALKILYDSGYDAHMTIVGEYQGNQSYYQSLCKLCGNLGVSDRIVFTGKISDSDLTSSYRSHDIFLFPNHLQSWGLAVFEAMASGCPVIVSKTAGASEVLTDGENALLVPPKNP